MSMTNVHSQTNGQQSQGCTVTPSASKHGSIALDDLSGGTKKMSGAAAGGCGEKDTITQSSECSLPDCSTATSVLSQTWASKSPPAGDQDKQRLPTSVVSPTTATSSLHKPKRKPAPSKPGSACSSNPAMHENLPQASSPRPLSSTPTSALLPSSTPTPMENFNTNRNNSTAFNKTPPPPFSPSPFTSPLASPSPVPSFRFRETPILHRALRAASSSAKYQTLPIEEGGRSRARRRYSFSEEGSKTLLSHQGGGAPKLGRVLRNKRSQSMSGMLLPKEEDGDSEKVRCDSDWILESTVWSGTRQHS